MPLASLRSKAHGLLLHHRSRRIGQIVKGCFSSEKRRYLPPLYCCDKSTWPTIDLAPPNHFVPVPRGVVEDAPKKPGRPIVWPFSMPGPCCLSVAYPNARFTFSDAAFVTILRRPSGHRPSSDAARRTPPRADERVKAAGCSGDGRPGTGAASEGDWPGPRESDPRQRGLETLEVFVEGTRSRDRRFLAPKTGLIRALQVLHEISLSLSSSSLWWWSSSSSSLSFVSHVELSRKVNFP